MIFGSDLDQTLIYSINFLNKHYTSPIGTIAGKLSIIEYYQGKPLTYIHNDVITLLKTLDYHDLFVPVTTRTEEQYKRIDFSKLGINPTYAITTNGAKVLKHGKIDNNWQEFIHEQLRKISLKPKEINDLIKATFPQEVIKKIRVAENTFTYCVLFRDKLQDRQLKAINRFFNANEWNLSLQGTKLYFMPKVLCKATAMTYICEQLKIDHYIAAGDSLLDLPLLTKAKEGYIPRHGEIFEQELYSKYQLKVSTKLRVDASLSIVNNALKKLGY